MKVWVVEEPMMALVERCLNLALKHHYYPRMERILLKDLDANIDDLDQEIEAIGELLDQLEAAHED